MVSGAQANSKTGAVRCHCDYCRKDIFSVVHVRCAECPDFDLCLECFSVGVEVHPHKNDHDYFVIDHVTEPIFDEEWGADEEMLLLDGIEAFGLGNWADIAEHVGSKNKARCEQHYYELYLESQTAPLPDIKADLLRKERKQKQVTPAPSPTSHDVEEEKEEPKSSRKNKSKAARPKHQSSGSEVHKKKAQGSLEKLVGYTPHRQDFDFEWDNDAELILADMEFKDEDTPQERELKLRVLDIYNQKLDQRSQRKDFILHRDLLDQPRDVRKRSPLEQEIEENVKVFARFHSKAEHEQFVAGLINEHRLRKRIDQLQRYRLNGVRSLVDGEALDVQRHGKDGSSQKKRPATGSATPQQAKRQKVDVTTLDGFSTLGKNEQQLCRTLSITPAQYTSIANKIVQEAYARNLLGPNAPQQLLRVDVKQTDAAMDFFVSVGWADGAYKSRLTPQTSSSVPQHPPSDPGKK